MTDPDRAALVTELAGLDVATVHEAYGRRGDLGPQIRPIQAGRRVAGQALTAAVAPGDNLAIHRALLAARSGDVLVVAAAGHVAGYWGEILAVAAQARGVVGLIIDGGCRDVEALRRRGFPVWSTGISVHGMAKAQPGTVNETVSVGGVVVHPGDYVLADDDGVVVVARDAISGVVAAAQARAQKEERIMAELERGGNTIDLMGLPRDEEAGRAPAAESARG